MQINLTKDNIFLLLDALYSYQLDIEHGNDNGSPYVWTETQVELLIKKLDKIIEKVKKV
jgi:hypothetical protein